MKRLSNLQKRYLKGSAHHLEPVVMLGKNGITDNLIKMTNMALASHELIKVRFVDFKDDKKDLSAELANRTGSDVVGIIGHIAILFRQNKDKEKRKIHLPRE